VVEHPDSEALPYEVVGEALHCPICGHDRFHARRMRVETLGRFLLHRVEPTAYVCAQCGHMLWFWPEESR
jgi:hypothetical protein